MQIWGYDEQNGGDMARGEVTGMKMGCKEADVMCGSYRYTVHVKRGKGMWSEQGWHQHRATGEVPYMHTMLEGLDSLERVKCKGQEAEEIQK